MIFGISVPIVSRKYSNIIGIKISIDQCNQLVHLRYCQKSFMYCLRYAPSLTVVEMKTQESYDEKKKKRSN